MSLYRKCGGRACGKEFDGLRLWERRQYIYIYADPHNARACNAPRVVQVDACPSSIRLRGGRGGRRRRLGAAIAANSTRRSRNMIVCDEIGRAFLALIWGVCLLLGISLAVLSPLLRELGVLFYVLAALWRGNKVKS